MKKIDTSSPARFMQSLRSRARGIRDDQFRSAHTFTPQGDDPPSGKWGGVPVCLGIAQKNGVIAFRNTNDSKKNTVLCTRKEFRAFLKAAKAGHFDSLA